MSFYSWFHPGQYLECTITTWRLLRMLFLGSPQETCSPPENRVKENREGLTRSPGDGLPVEGRGGSCPGPVAEARPALAVAQLGATRQRRPSCPAQHQVLGAAGRGERSHCLCRQTRLSRSSLPLPRPLLSRSSGSSSSPTPSPFGSLSRLRTNPEMNERIKTVVSAGSLS